MKILFVVPTLANGGAEKVCVNVATGLYERGHEVKIVTTRKFECDYIPPYDMHMDLYNDIAHSKGPFKITEGWAIRKVVKQWKPEYTVSFMHHTNLLTYLATRGLDTRFIATNHITFFKPEYVKEKWWDTVVKRKMICLYPNLTVLTNDDKLAAMKYNKHVVVMPNPHNVSYDVEPLKRKKRIVLAGRLDSWPYKGFDIAIKAWGRIQANYPDWQMEIYGRGSKEAMECLQGLIMEYSSEDRTLLMGFSRSVLDVFRSSEVFLLSSRYEGFGVALLEAMAAGCACVVCDYLNHQREFCTNDGIDAVVYAEPDDEDSIAKGLERIISDNELRNEMSERAVAQSKKYTVAQLALKWEKYLMSITGK